MANDDNAWRVIWRSWSVGVMVNHTARQEPALIRGRYLPIIRIVNEPGIGAP